MSGDRSLGRMLVDVILDPLYEFGDSNINSFASSFEFGVVDSGNGPVMANSDSAWSIMMD